MATPSARIGACWMLTLAILTLLSMGCTATRRDAVPPALTDKAQVPGYAGRIRYFPRDSGDVESLKQDVLDAYAREQAYFRIPAGAGPLPPAAFLAISGGGDDGAFGAGFLNGWTKAGTRPQFKLVTGISTGALIAPFAFLGPAYDDKLKRLYTSISFRAVRRCPGRQHTSVEPG